MKSKNDVLYTAEPKGGKDAGEFWHARFDRALKFRKKHWNGDKTWKNCLLMYEGKHWSAENNRTDTITADNARDQVTVNITGSSCLNMLPFLIRKRPSFKIDPSTPDFDVQAQIQEDILNYAWKEYKMQPQARKAALFAIITGHGIIKTGFTTEVNKSYKVPENGRIEYADYIKKLAPWIRCVSNFNFVYDPDAREHDLESARWCSEIIYLPLQDIMENERFREQAKKAIRDGDYEPTSVHSLLQMVGGLDNEKIEFEDNVDEYGDLKLIVCFDIWDKRSGKYYLFAHGVHEPLIEEPRWPYDYLEGFPFERYDFIPVLEDHYALGLVAFILDQQIELDRIRTSMFNHRRRFNRKYTALIGEVDEEELTKLVEGEDGTIVLVKSHDAIKPIDDARISSDEYNIESTIKNDIRELIGSDELTRGGALPSRTTATEIQARTRLYGLKLDDRVAQFDDFLERIGRKTLQHLKANWVPTDVIPITGALGHFWKSWTPQEIQGEFDFSIEPTSTEVVDPQTERQQLIQILQLTLNSMPYLVQSGYQVDLGQLFRLVLTRFETIKDLQRAFPDLAKVVQPIKQILPNQAGAAPAGPGGTNPGGDMANSPGTGGTPPNPMNQMAQPPQGSSGQMMAGLMGAQGG